MGRIVDILKWFDQQAYQAAKGYEGLFKKGSPPPRVVPLRRQRPVDRSATIEATRQHYASRPSIVAYERLKNLPDISLGTAATRRLEQYPRTRSALSGLIDVGIGVAVPLYALARAVWAASRAGFSTGEIATTLRNKGVVRPQQILGNVGQYGQAVLEGTIGLRGATAPVTQIATKKTLLAAAKKGSREAGKYFALGRAATGLEEYQDRPLTEQLFGAGKQAAVGYGLGRVAGFGLGSLAYGLESLGKGGQQLPPRRVRFTQYGKPGAFKQTRSAGFIDLGEIVRGVRRVLGFPAAERPLESSSRGRAGSQSTSGRPGQTGSQPPSSTLRSSAGRPQPPTSAGGQKLPAQSTIHSPSPVPSSSDNTTVDKIMQALRQAKPIRGQQEALYSKARRQQAAVLASISEQVRTGKITAQEGQILKLGSLKGELPKAHFEGIGNKLTQDDVNSLFRQVNNSLLPEFQKVSATEALRKIMRVEGGTVPTRSELELLGQVFPREFIETVLTKRPLWQKFLSASEEAINLPKASVSGLDFSASFRQGIFLAAKHPVLFSKSFGRQFQYAFSEKAYQGLQRDIQSRPTYKFMREAKVPLTDMEAGLLGREEKFMSTIIEKIPGIGKIYRGSNRAYIGFLNKLRADVFDDIYARGKAVGAHHNPKFLSSLGSFVGSASGRGDLGKLNKAAVALNGVFFSPRLIASRINLLNPIYYARLDPFVRQEALKSLFSFAAVAGTTLGLARLGGSQVGTDPRSADFGKIKIGNTRYDTLGGFGQYIRLAAQLTTGVRISSTTGKEEVLGEGYRPTTRLDILYRFLESKEAPALSFVVNWLKGSNFAGQDFNVTAETIDRFLPFVLQDMYDIAQDRSWADAWMVTPAIFGFGSQTYGQQVPIIGTTPAGKTKIQYRSNPSLGETLMSKIQDTPISPFSKEQQTALGKVKELENITSAIEDTQTAFKQEIVKIATDNTLTESQRQRKLTKAKERFRKRIRRIDASRK